MLCSVVEEYMLYVGGSIGYWQGDVKKLMDDLAALKPTLFVGVPRVFERICGGINDLVRDALIHCGVLRHFGFLGVQRFGLLLCPRPCAAGMHQQRQKRKLTFCHKFWLRAMAKGH
eukprot:scaffold128556_cov18-Tisochrysis_lutea.AAC.1